MLFFTRGFQKVRAFELSDEPPLGGRLHVSNSAYESFYNSVHNMHLKDLG
jgi:hypothetical protein